MDYMARALALAERGRGRTSPNPMVGALLVKDGTIIGEGYHRQAGGPHAEVFALRAAGEAARGATLYVSLEPCSYFGRTPPCTEAVIAAGVAEVHAAMLDPNPRVAGAGLRRLQEAGIHTVLGEHAAAAQAQNETFVTYITQRRPFVIAKWAMSLDGKIATHSGASRGLTGAAWQHELHVLRSQVDAILVGVNTVLADDPLLSARLPGVPRQPQRVVLDSRLRTPLTSRLLAQASGGQTLIVTSQQADPGQMAALRERGAQVLAAPGQTIELGPLLALLGEREISSLLVEGGGRVLASFFAARLVDKVMAVIAPLIVGGAGAPTPVAGEGATSIEQSLRLERSTVRQVGDETVITGYPRWDRG